MAFTYRIAKGSPLTHAEFDANMEYMQTLGDSVETAIEAGAIASAIVGSTIYDSGETYVAGAVVHDPAASYKSYISQEAGNSGNIPNSDDGTWWKPVLVPFIVVYDPAETYTIGEIVLDPDDSFLAYVSQDGGNSGHTPNSDDGTWWVRIYTDPYTPEVTQALGSLTTNTAINLVNGTIATMTIAGNLTLSFTNWLATGLYSEALLVMTNAGAHTVTWPTINWLLSSGAFTTTFASNEATLQASGVDFVFIWTINGGTTLYGKIIR